MTDRFTLMDTSGDKYDYCIFDNYAETIVGRDILIRCSDDYGIKSPERAQLIVDALNAYEPPSVLDALQDWLDIPWVHALDDEDLKSRKLRIGRTGPCFQILLVERQKDLLDVFVCHNYEGPLIKIYNHADIDKVKELIDFFHKFHGDDNGTE